MSDECAKPVSTWQLTDEQRQQIYEEEKRRIEKSLPMLSQKAKILIAVYSLGCLLTYFGIPATFIDFCGTRQWVYQPESDIFRSLFYAAVELIRPFLAVVIMSWVVFIPAGLIWGTWNCAADFIKFCKRLVNKN